LNETVAANITATESASSTEAWVTATETASASGESVTPTATASATDSYWAEPSATDSASAVEGDDEPITSYVDAIVTSYVEPSAPEATDSAVTVDSADGLVRRATRGLKKVVRRV
jgi:hypothetical protein